jgi:opacity protein-like surface antigen
MFRIIVILLGIIFSTSVFAGAENEMSSGNHVVIGVSPGVSWVSNNQRQTLYLQPDIENTYTADSNTSAFPSGEIFIGWQQPLVAAFIKYPLMGQLGINIGQTGNAKLSGDIWDDANPDFDNDSYHYKVSHTQLALQGRLISNSNFIVDPYVSASIGVGFNRAYDFTIQPKISEEVAAPPFSSNTTTTFTYSLGIGLQKTLTTNLQVALGYEFADWGKTQLSRATGQTVNQGLTLNHLYANQLQLSLFYIF